MSATKLARLWPWCAQLQSDTRPGWAPYACTKVRRHSGDHMAVVDGVLMARWPR